MNEINESEYKAKNITTNWTIKGDSLKITILNLEFEPVFKIADWQAIQLIKNLSMSESGVIPEGD